MGLIKDEFLSFYRISCQREAVVQQIRGTHGEETFWDLRFRRAFQDWEVNEFERMLALLHQHCEAVDTPNSMRWKVGNNGVFSVKSFYEKLLVRVEEVFPVKSI